MANQFEMKATQPLVTVIAACYNQSQYVVECLESIRRQSYTNLELIITDDCSPDDSVAVIQRWLDDHGVDASFITHQKNVGVCATLNEALRRATGEYVTIISGDDVYLPEKLADQVTLLERLPPKVGIVYSDCWQMDVDGKTLPKKFIEAHREFERMPEGDIFPILLEKNFLPAMTLLIRRQCYDTVGLYDEELCYEDFDMWLRISAQYHFAFSPLICARYRIVPNSVTRTLLHTVNAEPLRSNFRIYEKCLSARSMNRDLRRIITDHLESIAEQMYALNQRGRNYYLLMLSWYAPRPYTLGMLLGSLARVPFARFSDFVSWYGSIRKRMSTRGLMKN